MPRNALEDEVTKRRLKEAESPVATIRIPGDAKWTARVDQDASTPCGRCCWPDDCAVFLTCRKVVRVCPGCRADAVVLPAGLAWCRACGAIYHPADHEHGHALEGWTFPEAGRKGSQPGT